MNYIPRTIVTRDKILRFVDDDNLLKLKQSFVVLGEPGTGKTKLLKYLNNSKNTTFLDALTFIEKPLIGFRDDRNKIFLIDALDEYQTETKTDSINDILIKLRQLGSPNFILTCRTNEWSTSSNLAAENYHTSKLFIANFEPFNFDSSIIPLDGSNSCSKDKFKMSDNYIHRTLSYYEDNSVSTFIADNELVNLAQSIVILAEPGMGKTSLLEHLSNFENTIKFTASSFIRRPLGRLKGIDNCIVLIDALDEYQSKVSSNPIDDVLAKLFELGSPQFILSCRQIEWSESSISSIKDFYDKDPIISNIQPFNRTDAIIFLNTHERFTGDADEIVQRLDEVNLSDFYESPLTLELLTHIETKTLPNNKADILNLATQNLWQEINDNAPNRLISTDKETVLKCAGFICATLLLTQKETISTGNISKTSDNTLNIHKLKHTFDESLLLDTMKCRIFKSSDDKYGFKPMHRTIAEFLGAKWLAREMSDPMIKRRLLDQFIHEDGVPSTLRGMFSWLSYFNINLTEIVIDIDPYGLLTYADTSFFSDVQSKAMYRALKKLVESNPWFRKDNWYDIKAQGLAKPCLVEDYRQLLSDENYNPSLRLTIIQILQDANFVNELKDELVSIILDDKFRLSERYSSFELIYNKNLNVDWFSILDKLTNSSQEDDLRLVYKSMNDCHYSLITDEQVIQLLLNSQPLEKNLEKKSYLSSDIGSYYYFRSFPENRCLALVSKLVISIKELELPRFEVNHEASKNINRIILILLKRYASRSEKIIPTSIFYDAVSLFYHFKTGIDSNDYDRYKDFFDEYFLRNPKDKFIIQKSIIDNEEHITYRFWELGNSVLYSLYPNLEDLNSLLKYTQRACLQTDKNIEVWKNLINMSSTENSIPKIILKTISSYISGNQNLVSFVQLKTQPPVKEDWEIKNESYARKEKLKSKLFYQRLRNELRLKQFELESGNFDYCYQPASILLREIDSIPSELRYMERLKYVLKKELSESAVIGFENSLKNNILEPREFVVNKHNYIEAVLIAGIYCRLENNIAINDLSDETILVCAIIIEFNNFLYFDNDAQNRLSSKIREEIVYRDLKEELIDVLVITQFDQQTSIIHGMRWLTHNNISKNNIDTIVKLLEEHNDLNFDLQKQLVNSLFENKSINKLSNLIQLKTSSIEHLNDANNLQQASFWLALYGYINEKYFLHKMICFIRPKEVFWQLSKIYQNVGQNKQLTCSNSMKEWIIYRFNAFFPNQEMSRGGIYGDRNLYDGTEFINSLLTSLSNTPTDEAYGILKSFQSSIHPSYQVFVTHLLAQQQSKLREYRYVPSTLEALLSIYKNEPPQDCRDLRALVIALLDEIQAEIYGSETDPHKAFYQYIKKNEKSIPHSENDCRDRLAYFLKLKLQAYGFKLETERDMPDDKRADMVCSHANLHLPIEVKGQWHKDLWSAMNDQLGDLYLKEHQSQRQGIYLIFWFGQNVVNNRSLNTTAFNKTGISKKPNSARELKSFLDDRIEDKYKDGIEIYVMDISRD